MLQKVSRKFAKELFNKKEPFWILTSISLDINKGVYADYDLQSNYKTFDKMESRFKYHFCNEKDGKFPRYFVEY